MLRRTHRPSDSPHAGQGVLGRLGAARARAAKWAQGLPVAAHRPQPPEVMEELLGLADSFRREGELPELSASKNAHLTWSSSLLRDAFHGDFDWFEGDLVLRGGLRPLPGYRQREPVMGHNLSDTAGLRLDEWLQVVKRSGRGIKIDFKHAAAVPSALERLKAAGIADDKLLLNADVVGWPKGLEGFKYRVYHLFTDRFLGVEDLVKMREAFPKARINIGVRYGRALKDNPSRFTDEDVQGLIDAAKRLGGPVMFALRAEMLDEDIIRRLEAHGPVAAWNWPLHTTLRTVADCAELEGKLRAWGATGVVDLRPEE